MRWDDASNTSNTPPFRCLQVLHKPFMRFYNHTMQEAWVLSQDGRDGGMMWHVRFFTCLYHLCLVSHRRWLWFEWFFRRITVSCQPWSSCNRHFPFGSLFLCHSFKTVQTCFKHLWFCFLFGTMIDSQRFLRLIKCFHHGDTVLLGCDDGNPRFRRLSRLHNLLCRWVDVQTIYSLIENDVGVVGDWSKSNTCCCTWSFSGGYKGVDPHLFSSCPKKLTYRGYGCVPKDPCMVCMRI